MTHFHLSNERLTRSAVCCSYKALLYYCYIIIAAAEEPDKDDEAVCVGKNDIIEEACIGNKDSAGVDWYLAVTGTLLKARAAAEATQTALSFSFSAKRASLSSNSFNRLWTSSNKSFTGGGQTDFAISLYFWDRVNFFIRDHDNFIFFDFF